MKLSILEGARYSPPADQPASLARYIRQLVHLYPGNQYIEMNPLGECREQSSLELYRRSECLRKRISDNAPDSRDSAIVLCFQSMLDFIPAAWAALYLGYRCVIWPITDYRFNPHRFKQGLRILLDQMPNNLVLCDRELHDNVFATDAVFVGRRFLDTTGVNVECGSPDSNHRLSDTGEILIPTSGTTGNPNLAIIDPVSLINRFYNGLKLADHTAMSCLPHYSATGIRMLLPHTALFISFHPLLLLSRPKMFFQTIDRYCVYSVGLSSSVVAYLNRVMRTDPPACNLQSLQKLTFGMEVIVPHIAREFLHHLRCNGTRKLKVVLNYAMTESGAVCREELACEDFLARMDASDHLTIRDCRGSYAVQVRDERGVIIPQGQVGEVAIRSRSKLFAGYFAGNGVAGRGIGDDGWFTTGDRGWISNNGIVVLGRQSNTITINARKISCEEIEQLLGSLPDNRIQLAIAAPYREQSSITDDLVIFIVCQQADDDTIMNTLVREIVQSIAIQLSIPVRHIVAIADSEIERTTTLKVNRSNMVERYRQGDWSNLLPEIRSGDFRACTKLQADLQRCWQKILLLNSLPSIDDHFFELGGDSITLLNCVHDLEEQFGISVPLEAFLRQPTIAGIATYIEDRLENSIEKTVVSI